MLLTASVPIFLFVYIIFPSPASPLDKILTLGRTNKLVLLSLNRIFPGGEEVPLSGIQKHHDKTFLRVEGVSHPRNSPTPGGGGGGGEECSQVVSVVHVVFVVFF